MFIINPRKLSSYKKIYIKSAIKDGNLEERLIKLIAIFIFLIIFFLLKKNFLKKIIYINKEINIHEENKTVATNITEARKVCLCAIAKRENLYIKFFIEHYKKLGYDHIFLYDNNDINDEKIADVINDDINNGFVTIIDYRGYRGKRESPQMDAYYDCYEKHNLEYDWLSFFDIDEYLILKPDKVDIHNFLESERYKDCPNIKINWLVYSDNNQIKYEKKPLNERFTTLSEWTSSRKTIKSIMRGNISFHNLEKTYNPHYLYNNVKSCSSSGKFIEGTCFYSPPDYEFATLNHYIKTISEFTEKIKRGLACDKFVLNEYVLKNWFNTFFKICHKTEEKVKIFNEAFNTSFQ